MVAAGIFASQNKLPLEATLLLAPIAAIAGYQVGYLIGERAGPRLFKRSEGVLFRKEYRDRTEAFIKKHGGKSILLARFIVIVRTILPLMAGMGKMGKKKFLFYNVIGSVMWTTSVILAAYWLGHRLPNLDKYLVILLVGGMLITTGGGLLEILRTKQRREILKEALREEMQLLFKRKK